MAHVHHTSVAQAPLALVFDYVADYRNMSEWMFGIQKAKLIGGTANEVGSRYDVAMKLGATLRSTLEVTAKEANRLFVTESRAGVANRSTWHFEAVDDDSTRVTIDVDYELPGGLAGRALAKVVEPFIGIAVSQSDEKLSDILRRRYQG